MNKRKIDVYNARVAMAQAKHERRSKVLIETYQDFAARNRAQSKENRLLLIEICAIKLQLRRAA